MCLLQDIRTRGVTEVDLILTDGHEGLLAAVSALFTGTPRQRCLVHKQRNVMSAIPKREREPIAVELSGIWNQPTKDKALTELEAFKGKYRERYPEAIHSLSEDEEHLLTFYDFPQELHKHIRSTNPIESFFRNVRRRTNQIDTFTTEMSCLSIVWAVMQGIHLSKIPIS
jgi:transposase-like protein